MNLTRRALQTNVKLFEILESLETSSAIGIIMIMIYSEIDTELVLLTSLHKHF